MLPSTTQPPPTTNHPGGRCPQGGAPSPLTTPFTPVSDLLARELGLVTAAVYGVVWRYCQMPHGLCYASVERIAHHLGLEVKTARRHLKKLCQLGYLEDTTPGRKHRPHLYRDTGKAHPAIPILPSQPSAPLPPSEESALPLPSTPSASIRPSEPSDVPLPCSPIRPSEPSVVPLLSGPSAVPHRSPFHSHPALPETDTSASDRSPSQSHRSPFQSHPALPKTDTSASDRSPPRSHRSPPKSDPGLPQSPRRKGRHETKPGNKQETEAAARAAAASHPAITTFRAHAHRYPAKSWFQDVADTVGARPADLQFWGQVVKHWVGCGYNPTNVKGMLDCYRQRALPGGGPRRSGNRPSSRLDRTIQAGLRILEQTR